MAWTEYYVRSDAAGGGDGTTDTNSGANGAWTLAEAITSLGTGASGSHRRVNIRGGTYSFTTTAHTINVNSSSPDTNLTWWRGFESTPGDLDDKPASANATWTGPEFSYTSGSFTVTGFAHIFSNIKFTATSRNDYVVINVPANTTLMSIFARCVVDNQTANAGAGAIRIGQENAGPACFGCHFKATGTASRVVLASNSRELFGCHIQGGIIGIENNGTGGAGIALQDCVFTEQSSHAIDIDAATTINLSTRITGCTIYECGGDGIRIADTNPGRSVLIANNVFVRCGGYGINNLGSTVARQSHFRLFGNRFYSCTSGTVNGFGNTPEFESGTTAAEPLVDGDNLDMRPSVPVPDDMLAFPAVFTGPITAISKQASGALQNEPSGGSGGGPVLRSRILC